MPARSKEYNFLFGDRHVRVEAEREGEGRYLVRMSEPKGNGAGAFVRIGYLLGASKRWTVEHGAGKSVLSTSTISAKDACCQLARWALTQPAFTQPAFTRKAELSR